MAELMRIRAVAPPVSVFAWVIAVLAWEILPLTPDSASATAWVTATVDMPMASATA